MAFLGAVSLWAPTVEMHGSREPLGPVRRAVFGANVAPPFVTLDGGVRHIVGVQRYNATGAENPLLRRVFPEVERMSIIGFGLRLDPEAVMRVVPDAVFVWAGRDPALRATGQPGVVEFADSTRRQTENQLAIWHKLARLSARPNMGENLAGRYREHLASLSVQVEVVRGTRPPPKVAVLVGGFSLGYWLAPGSHFLAESFARLGVGLSSGPGRASFESLLQLDPDVLFLDASGTGDGMLPEDLATQPEWQALRAVRERRVYRMPALPGYSLPVTEPIRLRWLAEILFPDLACQARTEVRETFAEAYGLALAGDEIDALLELPANRESAGYARFGRQEE